MNIEELAFKDRKILANLNVIDLLDIIEFLQLDRKQWINQFSKTHNESIDIQKENKELKKQLKEYILENSYLDLAGNRCWVNKHSAKDVINILESTSLSQ